MRHGIGRLRAGGSGFNPLSLFAAGEQGVWYDPSDFASMFQDSAGTTPVTAVTQSAGKVLDKSGRSNHVTQTTAGSRPTVQQDGSGFLYLSLDGVVSALSSPAVVDLSGTNKVTVIWGMQTAQTATAVAYETSVSANTSAGAFNGITNNTVAGDFAPRLDSNGAGVSGATGASLGTPHSSVFTTFYDLSTTAGGVAVSVRRNGSAYATGGTNPTTANFGSLALYLGARGGASLPFGGRFYSFLIVGRQLTAGETTNVERYVGSKMGIAL